MITEKLEGIASGFKNKFSRVADYVNNPRNATKEMVQKKPPPVKALNVKKPKIGKVGSVDTAFYTKVSAGQNTKLRQGDSIADISAKLLGFIKKNEDEKKLHFELMRNFDMENIQEDERRHKELLDVLKKPKKDEVQKVKKEVKKKAEEPTKDTKKADTAAKDVKKQTEKTTAKPTTEAKPSSAKPVETQPAVSTPTVTVPKPPVSAGVSTATKVTVGAVAGISSAAALSIERETGKPASQAIKNVGQIVPNDPKPGVTSYGIFGINSQGSVQSFIQENPNLGITGKPATKEFDEQWSKVSKERPKEMLDAQLIWYDNHITKPLKKDLSVIVPKSFVDNPKIVTYFSDRRVQYGKVMETQAVSYASKAKTPEEFIALVTEYDLAHLKDAFKTYLSNHPDAIKGLEKRLKEREKVSLSTNVDIGNQLSQSSVQNKDFKTAQGNTIIIDNTSTIVASSGGNRSQQVIRVGSSSDLPVYQQGT